VTVVANRLLRPPVGPAEEVCRIQLRDNALLCWTISRSRRYRADPMNMTHMVATLPRSVCVETLEQSIVTLTRRHRILGSRIEEHGGAAFLCRDESYIPRIELVDLRSNSSVEDRSFDSQLRDIVHSRIWEPFSYDVDSGRSGPLIRAFLVRQSENISVFGLVIHHSLVDGVSVRIIALELNAIYKELARETSANRPFPVALDFIDHIVSLDAWLATVSGRSAIEYWRGKVLGIAETRLPSDPLISVNNDGTVKFRVLRGLVDSIRLFAKERKVRVSTVLLAAYLLSIVKATETEDCLVSVMHFGRDQMPLFRSIGCFATYMPVRVRAPRDSGFDKFLAAVERECEEIYNATSPYIFMDDPVLRHFPCFNFLEFPGEPDSRGLFSDPFQSPYPVGGPSSEGGGIPYEDGNLLVIRGVKDELRCMLAFRTDFYGAQTIRRSITDMMVILTLAIAEPARLLNQIFELCECWQGRSEFEEMFRVTDPWPE
jgi:Condensation domain